MTTKITGKHIRLRREILAVQIVWGPTGLHNFPDFWIICLICDRINPYSYLYFNPPL